MSDPDVSEELRELARKEAFSRQRVKIGSIEYTRIIGAIDATIEAIAPHLKAEGLREAPEWQLIETAPKDRLILICGGFFDWDASWGETLPFTGVTIASWKDIGTGKPWQGENCGGHDEYYRYAPTHWMLLPTPITGAALSPQAKETK